VNRGNAPPIRPKHFLKNISALIEIFQYLSIVSIIAMQQLYPPGSGGEGLG
jgi:hypothetical protein